MKYPKALEEVWKWKEEVYEEIKNMSDEEQIEYFQKGAEDFCERYNLQLRKAS